MALVARRQFGTRAARAGFGSHVVTYAATDGERARQPSLIAQHERGFARRGRDERTDVESYEAGNQLGIAPVQANSDPRPVVRDQCQRSTRRYLTPRTARAPPRIPSCRGPSAAIPRPGDRAS